MDKDEREKYPSTISIDRLMPLETLGERGIHERFRIILGGHLDGGKVI